MLIYDQTVTNSQIASIYEQIKAQCIFNKMSVREFDEGELNNGYKVTIFLCSGETYLKLHYPKSDFVNIFMPTDDAVLPYFLNNFKSEQSNDYMVVKEGGLDAGAVASVYFARFYNYIKELLTIQKSEIEFDFSLTQITQKNVFELLFGLNEMEFVDLQILSHANLSYSDLPFLDYLLISAFQVLISNLKVRSYTYADIYKVAKDNSAQIDKFFAMAQNQMLFNLISLNYNRLNLACNSTKNAILELLPNYNIKSAKIEELIKKIRDFSFSHDGLLSYMYLYNIFGD